MEEITEKFSLNNKFKITAMITLINRHFALTHQSWRVAQKHASLAA